MGDILEFSISNFLSLLGSSRRKSWSLLSSRKFVFHSSSSVLLWISLALVCIISHGSATPSNQNQIHTHMDETELRRIFQVDSHHQVPEYQVVSIHSRSKRSMDENRLVSFNAFGKDVRLHLEKNPHLVKQSLRMWIAEPDSSEGVNYKELPQEAEEDIGEAYQDESNQAALLIHHDKNDGSLLMDGMVGSNLVVKPVPTTLRQHSPTPKRDDSDEAFLDDEMGDEWVVKNGFPNMNDSIPFLNNTQGMHIVYQTKHIESHSDYAFMEPDQNPFKSSRQKRHADRTKRDAPYVIYPEILVIVDYDGYRLHGGDNLQVKRYFVSFWNGVDLRYKVLRGPKVRISIAGIIISRGRDATPYLERNRVGRDALDSASALTDLGKYLFQERRLPVYDIAVVVTKLDMCRRQFANDVCNRGTAGFAYVGGACVVNKRLEKVNSVAIVEDTGGFSGIIVAAHEVGHLLGCVHDGSPAPSYLGGPGAQKCRWEDGYIMSDLRHTERGFQWSACSISQFHHFLNGDTATCLYNSPHEDGSLPRVLPGKLLSLDAQCRKDRGTSACFKDDRVCAQLFCFDASSGYCVAYRPAAEGSPCGQQSSFCASGRCVVEHENIIPDYSQIAPVISRDPLSKGSSFTFPTSSSVVPTTLRPKSSKAPPLVTPRSAELSSTTRTTTRRTTTTTAVSIYRNNQPVPSRRDSDIAACVEDRVSSIGDLNCKSFLEKYGFKFCTSNYIKQNCCSSHKTVCSV
ncbi:A disintegrin and metalloproteinase with thrombospondin motifs 18 isoform X3 [Folsomia candida]|nr:A disintegrin and metalloproteinase with thrombospondin motifs 18 isoform X3 [Folsomia candida]